MDDCLLVGLHTRAPIDETACISSERQRNRRLSSSRDGCHLCTRRHLHEHEERASEERSVAGVAAYPIGFACFRSAENSDVRAHVMHLVTLILTSPRKNGKKTHLNELLARAWFGQINTILIQTDGAVCDVRTRPLTDG